MTIQDFKKFANQNSKFELEGTWIFNLNTLTANHAWKIEKSEYFNTKEEAIKFAILKYKYFANRLQKKNINRDVFIDKF